QTSNPSRSDRTWPLPQQPWVMRMTWSELLFAHWRVDPDKLARQLPAGVTLDTHEGNAWVGVVPFLMTDVAPRFSPALPGLSRFLELNVRTYVSVNGKPGVWFFSLDAENKIAVRVARATFNLPYMDAEMSMRENHREVSYSSRRTHRGEPAADFDATYRSIGESFEAEPGSLEHWLTARYCLYSVNRRGRVYRGEIDHPPWQLSKADYHPRANTMGKPLGFDFDEAPHVLYAQPVAVKAWIVSRCDHE
ncbi:MAG: DUF2071 domain-containing protein, partial [Planctomycetota bacterium]